ncbi:MAG TPA: SurA N-terminal domain-containing protein [Magnetospirillum sp.]|nr:SurA N-terminal domain-containing protein [Magnetospirillum sp.]
MLDTFRNASKSWFVKLLFALLVLSFLAWGVGDVIRGGLFGHGPAIEVGSVQVTAAEVNVEFKREVDRMNPVFGGKLTAEDARKLGFMDRAIENIVTRVLIEEASRRLGLAASDDNVVARIAADPSFRNDKGEFDRRLFGAVLQRANLSEKEFLRRERANIVRTQLAEGLSGGIAAPKDLVAPLTRYREERRVAEAIVLRDDSLPLPPAPDAGQLEAYYKANAQRFMAPEFRALTVLVIKSAAVAAKVEVTPEMVEDAYNTRLDEFQPAGRVLMSQIVLTDKAQADKAAALVKAGKDLNAIAKELGAKVVDLGSVDRSDLPEELANAVFAAAPGATTEPVKTPLGWHVAQTRVRPVAEVKKQIEAELRAEKTNERMNELNTQIEDALGASTPLEEVAARFDLRIAKLPAIDAHGKNPAGKPVADLPKGDSFLDVAFHTDQGTESQLTEANGDGFFIVRVDSVTPPQPRPLLEVKNEVVSAWQTERRHEMAKERAGKIAEGLQAGKAAAELAQSLGGKAQTSKPFTREGGEDASLPPGLVSDLFKANVGGVASAAAQGGWVVGRLAKIVPFDPAQQPQVTETASRQLTQTLGGDLIDQYLAALNASVGVKVDRSQLSREE